MHRPELFVLFTAPFEDMGLAYMVTGSVASIVYGEPRLTHDIDLVLALNAEDASRLPEAFPLESFYCPPVEVLEVEARRPQRGHFNLIHHETGYKADVYVKGSDPLHAWAFERRQRIDLGEGASLWVAPPEYVIVRKLEYYREGRSEKHLRDIAAILATSPDLVDRRVLAEWIATLGVEKEWHSVER